MTAATTSRSHWQVGFLYSVGLVVWLGLNSCTPQGDVRIGADGFEDDFSRKELGSDWKSTGGPYRINHGQLKIKGGRNRPLWLRRTLPRDVRIEFDVRSDSADGDIKVEVFGDGQSKATTASYTATSYVVIFGGWHNTRNVLARLDEHGKDRITGKTLRVEPNKTYRMKIERRDGTITAWVDDSELMHLTDPDPLYGPGHDHFAFNNWESALTFDNFRVESL